MYGPYMYAYYILYVYGQSLVLNAICHVFPCVTIRYTLYMHAYYMLYDIPLYMLTFILVIYYICMSYTSTMCLAIILVTLYPLILL